MGIFMSLEESRACHEFNTTHRILLLRMSSLTPAVGAIIAINIVVYLLQNMFDPSLIFWLALWPAGLEELTRGIPMAQSLPHFHLWQLLTYGFLHGPVFHIFFNMLGLFMFGAPLEQAWGARRFVFYYIVCILGAGLCQLVVASWAVKSGQLYPTLGASGGVYGLLLAFGMRYPNRIIMLLIPPIPMPAKYFVILFGAFELWAGISGTQAGVAHFAHLGGMLAGFLLLWLGTSQRRR